MIDTMYIIMLIIPNSMTKVIYSPLYFSWTMEIMIR